MEIYFHTGSGLTAYIYTDKRHPMSFSPQKKTLAMYMPTSAVSDRTGGTDKNIILVLAADWQMSLSSMRKTFKSTPAKNIRPPLER
jgi:hypothetical protein